MQRLSVGALRRVGRLLTTPSQDHGAPMRVDNPPAGASRPTSTISRPVSSTVLDDPLRRLDRTDWPGPNSLRTGAGAPGPDYWQQRADYTIVATLDTGSRAIHGTVSIRYTNNSPDTLRFVWIQLDQNLYRPGSKGSALFTSDSRTGVRGFRGGYDITGLQVDGRGIVGKIDDTMMRIDLDAPLPPGGGIANIGLQYSFAIPEHGSDRLGRDSTLYEIAQWYPRMVVYDDVRGWNTDPYLGQGEFYLEYGDIDYAITVPAGYVVAGSGVLQNRAEVLPPAQMDRLDRAAKSPQRGSDHYGRRSGAGKAAQCAGNKDVALPRRARSRCRVGRGTGLSLGRGELERRADAGVL